MTIAIICGTVSDGWPPNWSECVLVATLIWFVAWTAMAAPSGRTRMTLRYTQDVSLYSKTTARHPVGELRYWQVLPAQSTVTKWKP